jgi:ubiquinone biosynthesis protein UbiJ
MIANLESQVAIKIKELEKSLAENNSLYLHVDKLEARINQLSNVS